MSKMKSFLFFPDISQAHRSRVSIAPLAGGGCKPFRLRRVQKDLPMFLCYQKTQRNSFLKKLRYSLTVACLLPALLSGCVAMGIPSVRYHDPEDRGGLLGPQRPVNPAEVAEASGGQVIVAGSDVPASYLGCNDLGGEGGCEGGEPKKPPEVPWPRFHPLPTRPVFSSSQL